MTPHVCQLLNFWTLALVSRTWSVGPKTNLRLRSSTWFWSSGRNWWVNQGQCKTTGDHMRPHETTGDQMTSDLDLVKFELMDKKCVCIFQNKAQRQQLQLKDGVLEKLDSFVNSIIRTLPEDLHTVLRPHETIWDLMWPTKSAWDQMFKHQTSWDRIRHQRTPHRGHTALRTHYPE